MATNRTHRPALIGRRLLKLALGALLAAAALSAAAAGYQSLTIVSPGNGSTIHDDNGRINITAAVSPQLRDDRGDRFVFIVDGVPMLPSRNASLSLEQMDRGSHTLQVEVIDNSGNTVIISAPRTIHLWEASALLPGPNQPQQQPQSQPPTTPSGPMTRPRGL